MISVPGGDPETQIIKHAMFYVHFRLTGAKNTTNTELLQLFGVSKPPPGGAAGPTLWGTLGGPKHNISKIK